MRCLAYEFHRGYGCDEAHFRSVCTTAHSSHYCLGQDVLRPDSPSDSCPIVFQFIHQFSLLVQDSALSMLPEWMAVADSSVSS